MYKYDFALSFAGQQRDVAERLAQLLKQQRVRIFYDMDEQAHLWGKDLYQHFQKVYGEEARFFVPFVSKEYVEGSWPKHELKQAQAREFKANTEYILPIRIDDSALPGLNITIGYLDLRRMSIEKVAELCLEKLVHDSAVRRLYFFLRDSNPELETIISQRPESVLLRLPPSHATTLEGLLVAVGPNVATGQDHHNTLINGGFGPPGHIPTILPEPHTTFMLHFGEGFYREII